MNNNKGFPNGKLQINELNLKELHTIKPSIVIITKRGGGKTWVCRSLLNEFRDIPVGIIISHTEKSDPFFQKFFPDSFIYNEYKPVIFRKIIARQQRIKEKNQRLAKEGKKIDTRLFLLMDDCLSSNKEWTKDTALREILLDGRHLDITYILTMQTPLGVPPEMRDNFDYVFLLYTDNYTEQRKFYEHYTGMFPTFNLFKDVYDRLTENYGCMVIKKRNPGHNISDKIYYFKAENIQPQMIGCRQLLKYHKRNYDNEWYKKSIYNKFDVDKIIKRNRGVIDVERVNKFKSH